MYDYIMEKFGEIYADNFRQKLITFLQLLSKEPHLGRPAKKDSSLRVYIFNKQNKIVYKIKEKDVTIIRILHTNTNLASRF
ncbi:MAG TPA: type II toxin-antitoxin system RelE/ParE family toxin [Segetibacter sp.]